MKTKLNEYDVGFVIELEAENLEDAAAITRFGLNSSKECYYKASFVGQKNENTFHLSIAIRAKKKCVSEIK